MTDSSNQKSTNDEDPDVGLVPDEALPEDLQPTEDNPLAQEPDDADDPGDPGDPGTSP